MCAQGNLFEERKRKKGRRGLGGKERIRSKTNTNPDHPLRSAVAREEKKRKLASTSFDVRGNELKAFGGLTWDEISRNVSDVHMFLTI